MSVLVGVIVTLGMLVIVPMGLRLMDLPGLARLSRMWPLFAVPGAVCLWLPRGLPAGALAGCYALGTVLLALHIPRRLLRTAGAGRSSPGGRDRRHPAEPPASALPPAAAPAPAVPPAATLSPAAPPPAVPPAADVAVLTALAGPAIAALALVAERLGHGLFGFDLEILALTVPHFHFAGFAAALVAGLVCRTVDRPAARFAAYSVPAGTLLVLLGYFLDDWVELAGTLVLTAGMWTVARLTWREIARAQDDPATRALLAVSAAVLVATMLLAVSWALGEATGLPHPTLTWMAATHGLGNALGFALCSVLAWRRLKETPA
ncbi:YndJ family protein [Streptomyces sp. NPDC015131]|uniref:YndJ family protein n=1 Tax=Streptomyces sp. NPDC015131 TaxID=3364941 RepID=UPI0036F64BAE